jgi:predicted Zn-dependent protease
MQPNVVLPLVRSLLETNRKREAEQLALQLIAAEKTAEPTYDLLYLFYTRENRAADAEKILEQKVENNPNSATARLQLAAHYVRLKQRPEMARALKPMLDRPKEFPNGQLQVGDFYSSIGDGQEALTYYQRGLSTSPDKLLYQKRIIGTLVQQNRRDEAAKMVEVALKEHADDDELKTAKATLLLSTGKPADIEAATSIFAELVKQKPNDPARRLQLGRSAMLKGDLDSAKAELNEALRRLPSSVPLRVLLTDITLRKREFGESLRFSDEILKFEPGNLGARLARSASLIGLGRFKEARPELDKVLAKQPESVDAQMQLGSLDLVEGRSKDAADVFRKSRETISGRSKDSLRRKLRSTNRTVRCS